MFEVQFYNPDDVIIKKDGTRDYSKVKIEVVTVEAGNNFLAIEKVKQMKQGYSVFSSRLKSAAEIHSDKVHNNIFDSFEKNLKRLSRCYHCKEKNLCRDYFLINRVFKSDSEFLS